MRRAAGLVVLALLLAALILNPAWFDWLFAPLTRNGAPAMYTHTSLLRLTLSHLAIVALSVSVSVLIAVPAAIWVTRGAGREFLPLVRTLVGIGQTFPPVAVLALAVPMMGFGAAPTFLALTLYGLLPIFENSLAALSNLPAPVVEAARGMGMTEGQVLRQVELPLALPLIIAGVRLTTVISLSHRRHRLHRGSQEPGRSDHCRSVVGQCGVHPPGRLHHRRTGRADPRIAVLGRNPQPPCLIGP